MGNPFVIDKVMITLTVMLFVLIGSDVYKTASNINKCKDNNAVAVKAVGGYVCVKNTAITEVN